MGNLFCGSGMTEAQVTTTSSSNSNSTTTRGFESTGGKGVVCLGAGCYWGTEKYIRHNFPMQPNLPPGEILSGAVGFMGPKNAPANPSYEDVCTGKTGHVEVYNCEFTGGELYYEAIIRYFFQFHDPTTLNRQGNDRGTQYASVIYAYDQKQFDIATRVKKEVQALLDAGELKNAYSSVRVSTDVRMVEAPFFPAHQGHQDYLMKKPNGYCNHRLYVKEWPSLAKKNEDKGGGKSDL